MAWHTAAFNRVKKMDPLRVVIAKIDQAVKQAQKNVEKEEKPSTKEIAQRKGLRIE